MFIMFIMCNMCTILFPALGLNKQLYLSISILFGAVNKMMAYLISSFPFFID